MPTMKICQYCNKETIFARFYNCGCKKRVEELIIDNLRKQIRKNSLAESASINRDTKGRFTNGD